MAKISLSLMDIYPEMLQDNYELCEEILKDYGYTENDFFKRFMDKMREDGHNNLSNRLVQLMFFVTEDMIKEKNPNADVDYYINGSLDTHFYIDGEQQ